MSAFVVFCIPAFVCICMFVCVRSCLGMNVSIFMQVYLRVRSCMHAWVCLCPCVHVSVCGCFCEQVTFVSDEVSAEDDEEAEQDEDDNSHHSSDHSVVNPWRGQHGCGVLRGGRWTGEERTEEKVKGKSCSKEKDRGIIEREKDGKDRTDEKERQNSKRK